MKIGIETAETETRAAKKKDNRESSAVRTADTTREKYKTAEESNREDAAAKATESTRLQITQNQNNQ